MTSPTKHTLRTLARRAIAFEESKVIDDTLAELVAATAPELTEHLGVGVAVASARLVAASDKSLRSLRVRQRPPGSSLVPIGASRRCRWAPGSSSHNGGSV